MARAGAWPLITCDLEDPIILKAFAVRPLDWIDIEGVFVREGSRLNRALVPQELSPRVELKEEPEILDQLQLIFKKHGPSQHG